MPFEATRTLAWSVNVPAAEDEDESASPKKPAHAAVSATTITRFMLRAEEQLVEGKSRRRQLRALLLKQQRGRDGHEHLTVGDESVDLAEFTFPFEEIRSALKAELPNPGACIRLSDGSSLYYGTRRWEELLDALGASGIFISQGRERVWWFQHSYLGIWLAGRRWKRKHSDS